LLIRYHAVQIYRAVQSTLLERLRHGLLPCLMELKVGHLSGPNRMVVGDGKANGLGKLPWR